MFSSEKDGGNDRPHRFMQAFRDVLEECELEDIGFSGDAYTWKCGRLRERLDRDVATTSWSLMHPLVVLQYLGYIQSDHRPILLDTEYQDASWQPQSAPRRFEAKWLKEKNFRDIVSQAWEATAHAIPNGSVFARLGHLHGALHEWDNTILKQPKKRLRKAQREFDKALSGAMTDEGEAKAKDLARVIDLLPEQGNPMVSKVSCKSAATRRSKYIFLS